LAKVALDDKTGDEAEEDQKTVFDTQKLGRSGFPKARFAFSTFFRFVFCFGSMLSAILLASTSSFYAFAHACGSEALLAVSWFIVFSKKKTAVESGCRNGKDKIPQREPERCMLAKQSEDTSAKRDPLKEACLARGVWVNS
jgi:hypothetical protein